MHGLSQGAGARLVNLPVQEQVHGIDAHRVQDHEVQGVLRPVGGDHWQGKGAAALKRLNDLTLMSDDLVRHESQGVGEAAVGGGQQRRRVGGAR